MGINYSMAGLVLVIRKGNPKYVKHVVPIWHSEIVVRWIIFSSDTLIGTGKDLLKFTFKPVEQGKTCRISFNHETYRVSTGRIIRVSSACCTIEKSPPKFWPRGWLIKVLLPASLITNWRRSSSSTNSKDPLVLLPSCTLKGLPVTPFRSTKEALELIVSFIHCTHLSKNPCAWGPPESLDVQFCQKPSQSPIDTSWI